MSASVGKATTCLGPFIRPVAGCKAYRRSQAGTRRPGGCPPRSPFTNGKADGRRCWARCAAADRARFAVLAEAGFEIVRWHQDLVRAVAPPLPSPPLPGFTIVRYSAGYEEAARIAHNGAYADDPGALLPDVRSWPQHATGLANFLPDASFLVLPGPTADQDIAGFLFSLEHHDSTGISEGSLHCLGTRKPWRRRGLATTLIGHALAAYQLAGFTTARLEVDSTNTSALRLYNQLGFTASGRGYAMLQAAAP